MAFDTGHFAERILKLDLPHTTDTASLTPRTVEPKPVIGDQCDVNPSAPAPLKVCVAHSRAKQHAMGRIHSCFYEISITSFVLFSDGVFPYASPCLQP